MHWRMVDVDGKKVPDWDGTYISVFVPIKGDTIILMMVGHDKLSTTINNYFIRYRVVL